MGWFSRHQHMWETISRNFQPSKVEGDIKIWGDFTEERDATMQVLYGRTTTVQRCTICGLETSRATAGDARVDDD